VGFTGLLLSVAGNSVNLAPINYFDEGSDCLLRITNSQEMVGVIHAFHVKVYRQPIIIMYPMPTQPWQIPLGSEEDRLGEQCICDQRCLETICGSCTCTGASKGAESVKVVVGVCIIVGLE
jgi:hypothetical protein